MRSAGKERIAGGAALGVMLLVASVVATVGADGATPAVPKAARKTTAISAAAIKEAVAVYQTRCLTCHGPNGKGDGAMAKTLQPKPRDLGDPAWQKSVTDGHIEEIILGGGAAVGMSPLMPANADLDRKPDVVMVLRMKVRSFGETK